MGQPSEGIEKAAPDDGIKRIEIPAPFSDWGTPVVFIAIVANIATGNYLRSRMFFQTATTFEQVAFAVACLLATSLPFVIAYGVWRLYRRRTSRAIRQWQADWSDDAAAERIFQGMTKGDMFDRCRVFCAWSQERKPGTHAYVIHWHDEVAAIDPVKTPFEPRLIEAEDPLLDSDDDSEVSLVPSEDVTGTTPNAPKLDGNRRTRRTVALIGIAMIAASILWVAAELAQSPRIQWITDMLFPLTGTVLVAITIWGLRGLLNRDRWLLVPGGVVLRRSRGARSGVEIHLFDRRKSVACVLELTDSDWLVTLQSGQSVAQRRVTPPQLKRFLRTWLSPIPPPVERLVDLE